MKAVLALIVIYVGTFLIAIQGASTNSAQAAQPAPQEVQQPKIDPAKEADIRSLLELVGARDVIQDAANGSVEQFKEKISASVPNKERAQNISNTFADDFQKKCDPDAMIEQLVAIYDKHYTADEIKSLLQFYGSPIGQKVAAESPKINREILTTIRTLSNQAAREAWQELKAENPGAGQRNRPFARRRGQPAPTQSQDNASASSQSDPQ